MGSSIPTRFVKRDSVLILALLAAQLMELRWASALMEPALVERRPHLVFSGGVAATIKKIDPIPTGADGVVTAKISNRSQDTYRKIFPKTVGNFSGHHPVCSCWDRVYFLY